jgi:hypothetical protein
MPSIAVGTSAVGLTGLGPGRRSITIRNASTGGQTVYIDNVPPGGLTTTNAGYQLSPGEFMSWIAFFDGKEIKQPWSAIADGAGGLVYYKELNDTQGD